MSNGKKIKNKKQGPIPQVVTPHIFIATPCYGGTVCVDYCNSLIQTIGDLSSHGVAVTPWVKPGGPYIVTERNHAVQAFLKTSATHLLFIDADLGFDPTAARKLLCHKQPIVAGFYRYKHETEDYPARVYIGEDGNPIVTDTGLIKCDGLATGFMMIQRWVIEEMIKFYPDLTGMLMGEPYWNLFDCVYRNNQWWGEDYVFCKRFIGMGGELWADPDITFTHHGQFGFTGNWHSFMERRLKEAQPQTKENNDEKGQERPQENP